MNWTLESIQEEHYNKEKRFAFDVFYWEDNQWKFFWKYPDFWCAYSQCQYNEYNCGYPSYMVIHELKD